MTFTSLKDIHILVIPSAVGRAHLLRLLLIAWELRRRGAEVAFAFRDQDELLVGQGFQVYPVADVTITDFSANVYAAYSPALIQQAVQDELAAIEAFRPHLILGDFRLTAAISSRLAHLPYVSVVSGYMTDYFNIVDAMVSAEARPLQHGLASAVTRAIQARQKKALAADFRQVARQYKLRQLDSLYDFLTGDLTLLADLPAFCPLEGAPATFRYIGPLIWEGIDETVPAYVEELARSRPLLYATLGNTGDEKFIQLVVEAFQDDPDYEIILTTGAYIGPDIVPDVAHIHAERFLPGSAIMRLSQAVIHCSGQGTTYQALAQERPALVIPFNNDQRNVAWLVKKNQVGIPMSPVNLTGERIRAALEELLADKDILKNVHRFHTLLAGVNAPQAAAEAIASFLEGRAVNAGQADNNVSL